MRKTHYAQEEKSTTYFNWHRLFYFFLVLLPKVGCQLPTETYGMLRGSNILLKGFVLFHGHLADN